jgi:hypothetical protein
MALISKEFIKEYLSLKDGVNDMFLAKKENEIYYAVFYVGRQRCTGMGLVGVFDTEEKAKEYVGDKWLIIKPITINKVYERGI